MFFLSYFELLISSTNKVERHFLKNTIWDAYYKKMLHLTISKKIEVFEKNPTN